MSIKKIITGLTLSLLLSSGVAIAAEQGYASAQYNLGIMYNNGHGVVTDYVRAYMWFNLGAYNGNTLGSQNKASITQDMTSAQITKAQEMSSRCLESNYSDC